MFVNYKNHKILITYNDKEYIYHGVAFDTDQTSNENEFVARLEWRYECEQDTNNQIHVFDRMIDAIKTKIDKKIQTIEGVNTRSYKQNGISYFMSINKSDHESNTFYKGFKTYVYSHKDDDGYHYKTMPDIYIDDYIMTVNKEAWAQIRYIQIDSNNKRKYYAVYPDMSYTTFESVDVITGFKAKKSHGVISSQDTIETDILDKSNRHLTMRIPSYLYEILKDLSEENKTSVTQYIKDVLHKNIIETFERR